MYYSPSVECANSNDAFTTSNATGNGALTNPVGLLTSDEIMMAGGKYNTGNSTYYLYTNQYYWAGSPYYFDYSSAFEFRVVTSGYLDYGIVNNSRGLRPSVSLKPGAVLGGGDGTSGNPYTVSLS